MLRQVPMLSEIPLTPASAKLPSLLRNAVTRRRQKLRRYGDSPTAESVSGNAPISSDFNQ